MKKKLLICVAFSFVFFLGSIVHATTLTIIDWPTLIGSELDKGTHPDYQDSYQAYDTTNNLAFISGTSIVSSTIAGYDNIHNQIFLNDGYYGNGSSWIGTEANSWIKIDLGESYSINELLFGRDRLNYYDDRDPGQFLIQIAALDTIFSNGDATNDASEYTTIFDSITSTPAFSGSINRNDTVMAGFNEIDARFVKIIFANQGAAIDEIEIHGSPSAIPEPATMLLLGFGLLGLAGVSRRKK